MQFGAVNNAGVERTELVSTGAVPDGNNPVTLLITNPAPVGRGIQVGAFPAPPNTPTIGVLASAFSRGVWGRVPAAQQFAVGVAGSGRTGVTGESSSSGTGGDAGVRGTSDGINSNGVIGEAIMARSPMVYGVRVRAVTPAGSTARCE
jgi:hypothetical protein